LPLDQNKLGEKIYKRQFKLMNRVGQLGRQGVRGPAEQSEKRLLLSKRIVTQKKSTFKPKG
jgi:hypothetical protein